MNERRSLITVGSNTLRLQIEEMLISQLKRNTRSPRIHPDKQIVMLARNIDTFGFLLPCVIDEKNRLLTGTARNLGGRTVRNEGHTGHPHPAFE